jgi:protein phosphatase methylesterase 1
MLSGVASSASPPGSPSFPLPYGENGFRVGGLQAYLASPIPLIKEGPIVVLLHGANFSARSFHLLLPKLTRSGCFVISYDARGHGRSADGEGEPTADALVSDCFEVISAGLAERQRLLSEAGLTGDEGGIPICLAGHSFGASIAAHCSSIFSEKFSSDRARLAALCMLDMIEGTAIAALPHMKHVIEAKMPHSFSSVGEAVEWSLSSGTVRLRASAAVSVPYQLVPKPTEEHPEGVQWRAWPFMLSSRPCWEGWFHGTDERFLAAPCPKLLVLADVETLDSTLTIAQMQGKYELKMISGAGHTLHEDAPDKVGEALCAFFSRHGITKEAEKALLEAKLKRAKAAAAASPSASPAGFSPAR